MTSYKVGDVVRATSPQGAVIEGALVDAYGDPRIPFAGYTPEEAIKAGYAVELIKAAPSPTRKALDDAPRGSFVSCGPSYRLFVKSDAGWMEVNTFSLRLDTLKYAGVTLDELADWIANDKFTLTTPNGD